jgi:hypothetical protein
MNNKKHNTIRIVPKYNRKIVETGKIDIPNTYVHGHSLSWLGTGTSIKSFRVKPIWIYFKEIHVIKLREKHVVFVRVSDIYFIFIVTLYKIFTLGKTYLNKC